MLLRWWLWRILNRLHWCWILLHRSWSDQYILHHGCNHIDQNMSDTKRSMAQWHHRANYQNIRPQTDILWAITTDLGASKVADSHVSPLSLAVCCEEGSRNAGIPASSFSTCERKSYRWRASGWGDIAPSSPGCAAVGIWHRGLGCFWEKLKSFLIDLTYLTV